MKGVILRGGHLILESIPSVFDLHGSATPKDYAVACEDRTAQRYYSISHKAAAMTSGQLQDALKKVCLSYDRLAAGKTR